MKRIGPKMRRAASIVRANPGCSKLFVAEQLHAAAWNGRNYALGYEPINRAIRAGLIRARQGKGNRYSLNVSEE